MAGFILQLEDNGVLQHYWKAVYDLGEKKARRLFSMAMNKKGKQGHTAVVRALSKQTSIKQKDIRANMKFVRSSPATLTTRISGSGKPLSLKYFGAKQFSYGSKARVWGRQQKFKSAFIHAGRPGSGIMVGGGHVFVRTTGKSNPIKPLFGPSIPVEMLKDDAVEAFEQNAQEILIEVQRLMKVDGLPG